MLGAELYEAEEGTKRVIEWKQKYTVETAGLPSNVCLVPHADGTDVPLLALGQLMSRCIRMHVLE